MANHQMTQRAKHPPYFHPFQFTEKEMGIFVGKDGSGIKSHLKKFGRVGVKGVNLSVQMNGIYISARCHDDVMKVVGYLGIALTDMFPKEFYRHTFTEESLREFIGDKGCNVKSIGEHMEHKPFLHASLNGVLIKGRSWKTVDEVKMILKEMLVVLSPLDID
jgi:hypothetical protein